MPITLTIEHITGALFVAGCVILILHKFGLLHFGKREEKSIMEPRCPAHTDLVESIDKLDSKLSGIHDNQIKNIILHEEHQKRFNGGDLEIRNLKKDIKQLCIGVALLLERTGGKPKSFTRGESDEI